MTKFWLYIVLLLYGICPISAPVFAAEADSKAVVATADANELDKQLKLNKSALFAGANEQMRIDAASVLLADGDIRARQILLDALGQNENPAARQAVCQALIQTRGSLGSVKDAEDFIEPLFVLLKGDNDTQSKLAAESLLIFDYSGVADKLSDLINNPKNPIKARLNGIDALRLQPEMGAIIQLVELLNHSEPAIADAAEKALKPMGIEFVTKDEVTRKQIIKEIKRNGPDKFLRDWLVRQENDIRELTEQLDYWRSLYIGSLDQVYNGIDSEQQKGKFLLEQLKSDKAIIRLWGLNEVEQLRVGTGKLPDQIGPVLIEMVSDSDRAVRLKTAKLLSLMGQLNSSEKLLAQYDKENDAEVKDALFVALGEACYNAFLPSSKLKIDPAVRVKTLAIAGEYLSSADLQRSQDGAEVIEKMLEQNGLETSLVEKYFGLLGQRYSQITEEQDGQLRSEFLLAMGRLCSVSVYKEHASKLFTSFFEESLDDDDNSVREAGVEGLINVDKVSALVKCLAKDMANDKDGVVQDRLIELAGEVGVKKDVGWLTEKLGSEQQGEAAWKSLVRIFEREPDVDFLVGWWNDFGSSKAGLSDERKIAYLVIVNGKAKKAGKKSVSKKICGGLADLYIKVGDYDRGAEYLGFLGELSDSAEEKEVVRGRLLGVYLHRSNFDAAKELVEHCLLGADLDANSVIVKQIDSYLNKHNSDGGGAKLIKLLLDIKPVQARSMWDAQMKRWTAAGVDKPAKKEQSQPAAKAATKAAKPAEKPAEPVKAGDPNKAKAISK